MGPYIEKLWAISVGHWSHGVGRMKSVMIRVFLFKWSCSPLEQSWEVNGHITSQCCAKGATTYTIILFYDQKLPVLNIYSCLSQSWRSLAFKFKLTKYESFLLPWVSILESFFGGIISIVKMQMIQTKTKVKVNSKQKLCLDKVVCE